MEYLKRSRNSSSSPQSFEPTQSSKKQDTGSTPPPGWFDVHPKDSLNLDHEQGLGNLAKMTLNTVQTPSSQDATPSEFVEIMSDMKHTLCSLLSSFEANLIEKFDQRLRVVEDNNAKLKTKLQSQGNEIAQLQELALNAKRHAIRNEQYARRCNFRVLGIKAIKEETGEICKTLIFTLIREQLSYPVTEDNIISAHRLGTRKFEKPRSIIVCFASVDEKKAILKTRRQLKGTGIVLTEDLCIDQQTVLNRVYKHPLVKNSWASDAKIFGIVQEFQQYPERKVKFIYSQSVEEAILEANKSSMRKFPAEASGGNISRTY